MPSFSPPFLRRSARLAGRSPGAGAHLNAHRVVLDGEDMPWVEGHALAFVEEEADMPNAAPPEPLPSAREVAAAEAARARLYGDEALRLSGGGAVVRRRRETRACPFSAFSFSQPALSPLLSISAPPPARPAALRRRRPHPGDCRLAAPNRGHFHDPNHSPR